MVGIAKADYRLRVPEYRRLVSIADGDEDRVSLPYLHLLASYLPDALSKQRPSRVERLLVSRKLPKRLGADEVPLTLDNERSVGGVDGEYVDIKQPAATAPVN